MTGSKEKKSDDRYVRLLDALRAANEAATQAQDELDRAIEHYARFNGRPPSQAQRAAVGQLRAAAETALMQALRHRSMANREGGGS